MTTKGILTKWTLEENVSCLQSVRHAYRIDGKHSEEILMALKQVLDHVGQYIWGDLSHLLPLLLSFLLLLNKVSSDLFSSIIGRWLPGELEGGCCDLAGIQWTLWWSWPLC